MANLYTLDGRLYDFDAFKKQADYELVDYLAGIKEGKKQGQAIREAYNNLMNGIKDGSVYFNGTQYVDTLGRYSNDLGTPYNIAAYHIYSTQGRQPEYLDPSKINASENGALNTAIAKAILGSNPTEETLKAFYNLDPLKGNTRGIDNRIIYIGRRLGDLSGNLDGYLTGLSADKRKSFSKQLDTLSEYFIDGKLTPEEILEMLKMSLPMSTLLRTDFTPELTEEQTSITTLSEEQTALQKIDQNNDKIRQYLSSLYGMSSDYSIKPYKTYQRPALNSTVAMMWYNIFKVCKTDTLVNWIKGALANPASRNIQQNESIRRILQNGFGVDFTKINADEKYIPLMMDILITRKALPQIDDKQLHFIFQTKGGRSLIYDYDKHSFYTTNVWNIPKYYKEGRDYVQNNDPDLRKEADRRRYASAKQGGILKMGGGDTFNNVSPNDDYNWHDHTFKLYLSDLLDYIKTNGEEAALSINGLLDDHYRIYTDSGWGTEGFNRKQSKKQSDILTKNVLAYQNAIKSKEFAYVNDKGIVNSESHFTQNAKTATSKDSKKHGWVSDGLYGAKNDARRVLGRLNDYDDAQLKEALDAFKNLGWEMYLDKTTNYYKLRKSPNDTQPKPVTETEDDSSDDTFVDLAEGTTQVDGLQENPWAKAFPDLMGNSRLWLHLAGNMRANKILKPAIRPAHIDAPDHSRPQEDREDMLQAKRQLGAEQASVLRAEATTDDLVNKAALLRNLEAQRKSEQEGMLASDERKYQTDTEDQQLRRASTDARINANNENTEADLAAIREKAELDATTSKANVASINERLKEIESNMRLDIQTNHERTLQYAEASIDDWANNELQRYTGGLQLRLQNLIKDGKDTSDPEVAKLMNQISRARAWVAQRKIQMMAELQGYKYNPISLNHKLSEYMSHE